MHGRTDTELVRTYLASHDERAFRELVIRHRQMVYRTCMRMLGDSHEAQDATQAAFVVLVNKVGELKREGSLTGWLYDVARKVSLEALRRREKRAAREKEAAMIGDNGGDGDSQGHVEAALQFLDQEIAKLSGVLRQAVVLRYFEGHNEREAAVLAGCPLGTMKWRASEAVAQLRKRMARRGVAVTTLSLVGLLEAEAHAAVPEALFSSILTAANTVTATGAATASPGATSLAEGVMKVMFWTKVKVSATAACAAGALVCVTTAVTISMAEDQHADKPGHTTTITPEAVVPAKVPASAPEARPTETTTTPDAARKSGPTKVNVKVGGATVPLSVLKDGSDYFVVCPPCASRVSCEQLDQNKAAGKTMFKKGDTGYYACCAFCLNEMKKDTAGFAKLFEAGLKTNTPHRQ